MLPYMGIVLQFKGYSPEQLHDSVYTILKREIPEDKYVDLISYNQLHKDIFANYKLFYNNFAVFRLKPLYVLTVEALYSCGINLVLATVLPSLFFTGFLLILFYFALSKAAPFLWGLPFVVSVCVMLLSNTNELACISTPDAMSSFFVFLLFCNIFFNGKGLYSWILLVVCIAARIDNFLLSPLILAFYYLRSLNIKLAIKLVFILGVAAAVVIVVPFLLGDNIQWFRLFIFNPSIYMRYAAKSLLRLRTDFDMLLLILVFYFFACARYLKNKHFHKYIYGIFSAALIRFAIFPFSDERYFFIYKLLFVFLMCAFLSLELKKHFSTTNRSDGGDELNQLGFGQV